MCRRFFIAVIIAAVAAACGSSATSPSNAATGCQLSNGKVQVVFVYNRDRTQVPAAFAAAYVPTLALTDRGDPSQQISTNPTMTRVDDYTWTIAAGVFPNGDAMSHSATVIDLGLTFVGAPTPYAVTGVTANGAQIRKVTVTVPSGPFTSVDLGYFGVDACGTISV